MLANRLRDLKLGLTDNTIVVLLLRQWPQRDRRWNGDMKGAKGSTDEGGVRSPLLLRWPASLPAGRRVSQIGAAIDLLPTLADLAGIEIISSKPLDGVSLKPALLSRETSVADRMIFSHWRNRVSVRTQRFRLDHQGALFDMVADPGQRTDVSSTHAEEAARLRNAVAEWRGSVLPGYDQDERPFLIGHPEAEWTQIPARDGIAHGNIQRSNRFPNCSFFSNWTSLEDSITWNVEVAQSGRYEVDVYYTCPAADVGSTIQLSFKDAALNGTVVPAHDPPLRGGENDRVPRTESYVKDFRPLTLGTIELSAGRGKLTLRATEIAGAQVMDFRLLMFQRVD